MRALTVVLEPIGDALSRLLRAASRPVGDIGGYADHLLAHAAFNTGDDTSPRCECDKPANPRHDPGIRSASGGIGRLMGQCLI